jgi:hypothetical protein
MAIDINPGQPLRHVATFASTGNFVVPAGVTRIFASIHGTSGGGGGGGVGSRYSDGQNPGAAGGGGRIAGAWIQVVPSATYSVTVGAAGTGGTKATGQTYTAGGTGGTGGTSSFDGSALSVTGGTGGTGGRYGNRYTARYGGNPIAGSTGGASGTTALSTLPPSALSITRTGSITTQTTGATTGGGGGNSSQWASASNNAGGAGQAGIVYIYV